MGTFVQVPNLAPEVDEEIEIRVDIEEGAEPEKVVGVDQQTDDGQLAVDDEDEVMDVVSVDLFPGFDLSSLKHPDIPLEECYVEGVNLSEVRSIS